MAKEAAIGLKVDLNKWTSSLNMASAAAESIMSKNTS